MTANPSTVQGPEVRAFQITPRGTFTPTIELLNDERFPVCLYFISRHSGERFDFTLTPAAVAWMRETFSNLWFGDETAEIPAVQP